MWKEFKEFIMTGNVIDFAIAVILAGAVGLVVNGFVENIMMPIIGMAGEVDFSAKQHILSKNAEGEVTNAIRYGAWITSIINLFIVGFVLFLISKSAAKYKKPVEEAPAGPTQEELLAEIRDALKK